MNALRRDSSHTATSCIYMRTEQWVNSHTATYMGTDRKGSSSHCYLLHLHRYITQGQQPHFNILHMAAGSVWESSPHWYLVHVHCIRPQGQRPHCYPAHSRSPHCYLVHIHRCRIRGQRPHRSDMVPEGPRLGVRLAALRVGGERVQVGGCTPLAATPIQPFTHPSTPPMVLVHHTHIALAADELWVKGEGTNANCREVGKGARRHDAPSSHLFGAHVQSVHLLLPNRTAHGTSLKYRNA